MVKVFVAISFACGTLVPRMNELSSIQSSVVDSLSAHGYHVNTVSSCEGDEWPTVFMSKRTKSYSTRYAEVDGAGLVNGQPLSSFAF